MRDDSRISAHMCLFLVFLLCVYTLAIPTKNAHAQGPGFAAGEANLTPAPSGTGFGSYTSSGQVKGCAADTWTAMVNQAVNQTRRETAYNRRYIVKNDSGLQYSCFDQNIINTVQFIDPIFTASTYWENMSGIDILGGTTDIRIYDQSQDVEQPYLMQYLTPSSLEESLVLVVDSVFQNYIFSQFNHNYLSGKAVVGGTGSYISGGGISGTGLEPCVSMAEVWNAAKCMNMTGLIGAGVGEVVFPTFEQMAGGLEPREYPSGNGWDCN